MRVVVEVDQVVPQGEFKSIGSCVVGVSMGLVVVVGAEASELDGSCSDSPA